MLESASEDQIQGVTDHLVKMGFAVHRTTGARQSVLAAVGRRIDFDTRDLEVLSGVRARAPHQRALQAGRAAVPPRRHRRQAAQRSGNRRQGSRGDGRAMLGRIAGATVHRRRAGQQGRCESPAGRRFQTTQFALHLSGTRTGRAEAAARSRRPLWADGDQRGHGDFADRTDAAVHRHLPGGRAQHAELQPAARAGQGAQAGAA